ncbi:DUF1294 domain-containing protein [Zhenpiania hominis]|uniref:DUF1294 domain-containing protein n=1 Tax=Zhenpiania hominis TaxID=2763644 RepID=UPI0039F5284A
MIQLLLQYYGVMNLLAFAAFAADYLGKKFFIIRMPERIMVMLTACGGGIGALAVMVLFKHKTKDKVFRITVPIATAVHMAVLIYLILWELGVVS